MPDDVTQLVSDILDEGGFEASQAQALRWLDRRYKSMVARAESYRKVSTFATVADQQDYAVPAGLVRAIRIDLDGVDYGRLSPADIARGIRGYLLLGGDGIAFASAADASGAELVRLYPTPTEAGSTVTVFGAFMPPDLELGGSLLVDADMMEPLIAGAIATGLKREGRYDSAAAPEQEFMNGCEEWRVRTADRLRTKGPAQIRVVGINA